MIKYTVRILDLPYLILAMMIPLSVGILMSCTDSGPSKDTTIVVTFSGRIIEDCNGVYTVHSSSAQTGGCLSKREYVSGIYTDTRDEHGNVIRALFVPDLNGK